MNTKTRPTSLARRAAALVLVCTTFATLIGSQPAPLAAAAKPNIVVFYLDDAAPHDGRLWTDPVRTPAIYNTFIAHGIAFPNAIGEAPLCCPGRASLLTGLHTHNNGVGSNDARLFSPQETVAGELKDAGYSTMWIGKYMNRNQWLSPEGWAAHMAPWSAFDVLYGDPTYYDFTVRTKDAGDIHYTDTHSTQMLMDRAVMRLQAAPADKPIFAVLSSYDIHVPNQPMPQPANKMAMCNSMQPYSTPNYNEADVSDKPAYVRDTPLLPNAAGWSMTAYCREMFGFDQLVERVTDELEAEGRLDNTLLVFTADNGMVWGAHRLKNKAVPYATPVPLYMAWPERWGTTSRTVSEFVSNIDLAPTFCAMAGCTLGPYPTGQTNADGVSLLGLIDDGTSLGRDALLEQLPVRNGEKGGPTWAALRTTSTSPLGLWHYVEYETGERELYDLQADPYELNNRAGSPSYAGIQAALATRLNQLLSEGRVTRPDMSAWSTTTRKKYTGYSRFNDGPAADSTLAQQGSVGTKFKFQIDLRNNELSSDSFRVTASVGGSSLNVVWKIYGTDVTSYVSGDGLVLPINARATISLKVHVTMVTPFPKGSLATLQIHVQSTGNPDLTDHITLNFKR
ncbi:MAG TPA: sulfatase-like hydrolase/transferase [Candidatus Limnocylindria bacterium]|nr:sulfatase-like hydrolase/transferase [Candidatus Limnocylindria bacterium]